MSEPLPSDRPIRWGIAATGKISATLVDEIRRTPDCEVTAVGSRTKASAVRFAADHGIGRAHGSYAALVEDDEVDVVYVGASHNAHFPIARDCIQLGRPVLCEKPLTVDASQAATLVELARARGVFLMEAMWMRCRPGFAELQATLANGAIGDVLWLRAELGWSATPDQRRGRLADPAQAGGALLDVGVYPITLAYAILGPPHAIRAVAHISGGVDRTVAMAMSWDNGATALLGGSLESDLDRSAVFAGSEGRLEIAAPFHHVEKITVVPIDGPATSSTPPHEGEGYVHEIAEVVRCLRAGLTESPLVPLDDSLAVMRVLDQCRREIGLEYPDAAYG